MDLTSLLNTGKPPLTVSRIVSLISSDDAAFKLEQITDATFSIPEDASQCYHYFDQFLHLLASLDRQNGIDLDAQYTTTALKASLRACVNDLLVSSGLMWLLSLPHQISDTTWEMLGSSPTILVYVYGLVLAMANRPQVETGVCVEEMSHFVKAASAYVNAHLWLSVCSWKSEQGQQEHSTSFLDFVEMHIEGGRECRRNGTMQKALIDMLGILEDAQAAVLRSSIDQYLSNISLRPPFNDQEMILGKMAFDRYIEKRKKTSRQLVELSIEYENKRLEDTDTDMTESEATVFHRNPLISTAIMEPPPGSELERAQLLETPMSQWNYQLQTFPLSYFDHHLQQIIEKHYPNDKKTVLDLLLVEWMQKVEIENYLQTIMSYIIDRVREVQYDKRSSPFWAILHLFSRTDYSQGESKPLYGEISGAQVEADEGWVDQRKQKTCDRILQILTDANTNNKLTPWINDILQVASSRVLATYLEWIAHKVAPVDKSATRSPRIPAPGSKYSKQLNEVFKGEHIRNKADTVIPTLMRAMEITTFLELVERRAYLNVMLKTYFAKPPELAIELLVEDLLNVLTKESAFELFRVIGYTGRADTQWFSNHFLGPVVRKAGDGNRTWADTLVELLKSPGRFSPFFLRLFNAEESTAARMQKNDEPSRSRSLQLLKDRNVMQARPCGLLRFFEEIMKLQDPVRDMEVTNLWLMAWGLHEFEVDSTWLLHCFLFFGQASAGVKSQIDFYLRNFIRDHFHNVNTGLDNNNFEQAAHRRTEDSAEGLHFVRALADMALLSDIEDPEDVFTLLVSGLANPDKESIVYSYECTSIVLYETVLLLSDATEEIALLMDGDKSVTAEVQHDNQEDVQAEQPRKKARRETKAFRRKKGRKMLAEPELPPAVESNDSAAAVRSLCLYARRIVSVMLSVLTSEGIRYMTPELREYITASWANCQDIYAPLQFLVNLQHRSTMAGDIGKIIAIFDKHTAKSNVE